MDKSIFEKIADKEIPSAVIWEDDKYVAFLDINPIVKGHTLVVPKRNTGDYIFDLKAEEYTALLEAAKKVAKLLETKLKTERVLMWVEGFEVPHVHVHLLPANAGFHILEAEVMQVSKEDLAAIQQEILVA